MPRAARAARQAPGAAGIRVRPKIRFRDPTNRRHTLVSFFLPATLTGYSDLRLVGVEPLFAHPGAQEMPYAVVTRGGVWPTA